MGMALWERAAILTCIYISDEITFYENIFAL